MFPKINADLEKLNTLLMNSDKTYPMGKTFVFDYSTGQHHLIDGKMIECTPDEAISQWIEKVLRTELNKFAVYVEDETEGFGISVYQYIGERDLHMGYIASELKREITERLLKHRYIESIQDYMAERKNRDLLITFTAILITGSRLKKEVSLYGL